MDFFEVISSRYSVRAYTSQPVEDEKLSRVLDAARLAPTACNLQPFRLVVIKTEGREGELGRLYRQDWFSHAPIVIGMCAMSGEAWRRRDGKNYADVDATIAMDHLILAAAAQGLGTCWVAAFDPAAARELLGLPAGVEPLAFTPLGYPAHQPPPKHRKPIETWCGTNDGDQVRRAGDATDARRFACACPQNPHLHEGTADGTPLTLQSRVCQASGPSSSSTGIRRRATSAR